MRGWGLGVGGVGVGGWGVGGWDQYTWATLRNRVQKRTKVRKDWERAERWLHFEVKKAEYPERPPMGVPWTEVGTGVIPHFASTRRDAVPYDAPHIPNPTSPVHPRIPVSAPNATDNNTLLHTLVSTILCTTPHMLTHTDAHTDAHNNNTH